MSEESIKIEGKQEIPSEAMEKISRAIDSHPSEIYSDLFPKKVGLLYKESRERHSRHDWRRFDDGLIYESIQTGDDQKALEEAENFISTNDLEDVEPEDVVSVLKQIASELKGIKEQIEKSGKSTSPQVYYMKAVLVLNQLPEPKAFRLRQKQYTIAEKYLEAEKVVQAEERAYEAEIFRLRHSEKTFKAAESILKSKNYPNSLREDEDVRLALITIFKHEAERAFGKDTNNAKYKLKHAVSRIYEWREVFQTETDNQNSLDLSEFEVEDLEFARKIISENILTDQNYMKDKEGLSDILRKAGVLTREFE